MGGGADHGGHHGEGDFRAKVWSMSGGPNCRPKHWKRNTAIAMFGVFLTCIPIAMLSAKLEVYINDLTSRFAQFRRSSGATTSVTKSMRSVDNSQHIPG